MTALIILSFLGGVLTILSPCILPVLPFVFARADRPFLTTSAPLLGGMAVTFAVVASLAAVGGGWAVHANQYGRIAALGILALFGLTLLLPSLTASLARPLVALGARLSGPGTSASHGVAASFGLGIATGLLWAPCAGPILGLVLTGAALRGASASTTLLLLAYALGAATSLAAGLLVGGRVLAWMKQLLGPTEWLRRVMGGAIILATAAIALGFDTGFLTRVSLASTSGLEEGLVDRVRPAASSGVPAADSLMGRPSPSLAGAVAWLNSAPLSVDGLPGKVVLVDFWTYSCINCLRALPYVRAWDEKYRRFGLVVVGIHSPEFAFERDVENVRRAVQSLDVTYPVAVDDSLAIWRAFDNHYWPADYLIDADGRVRAYHFGEGHYTESEATIQRLLTEAGYQDVPSGFVQPQVSGAEAPADEGAMASPETYVGYARGTNFASGSVRADTASEYRTPDSLALNRWGLVGTWRVEARRAVLARAPGRLVYRFHARDLHMVLGPGSSSRPVRFRVSVDGAMPGPAHGTDTNARGEGTITAQRLYQLIRQEGPIGDHTFVIEFLDAGATAYAVTFG